MVIKGVIVGFICVFFNSVIKDGICVNVVVLGCIWILFILVSFLVD